MRNLIIFDIGETLINFNLKNQWRESLKSEVIPRFYKSLMKILDTSPDDTINYKEFEEKAYNSIAKSNPEEKSIAMTKRVEEYLEYFEIETSDWLIRSQIDQFYNVIKEKARLYPDVKPTLKKLGKLKFKMGLFSNTPWQSPGRLMENLLRDFGIRTFFDITLYSGDIEIRKPNPKIFEILSEKVEIPRKQMIYVGDQEVDIIGATNFGIPCVFLNRENRSLDKNCPLPTYEIQNLGELFDFIPFN